MYLQIPCARKGQILFCKKKKKKKKTQTRWFYQNNLWNWYNQNGGEFNWQYICCVWWTGSTDSRHTYGHKLCSSRRLRSFICTRQTSYRGFSRNQMLPGACFRSPGSKLLSITTQLHCGGHLGGRARLPDTSLEEDHPMPIPSVWF